MARKKRMGRIQKYHEQKRQEAKVNCVGRPRKLKTSENMSENISLMNPHILEHSETFKDLDNVQLSPGWNTSHSARQHTVYKVKEQSSSYKPLAISRSLTVQPDMT